MTEIVEGEVVEVKDLTTVIKETGVEKTMAGKLKEQFIGFIEQAEAFEIEAKSINITGAEQVEDMKRARALRLKIKDVRVAAEKTKVALKEDIVRNGKAIDGAYNIVVALTKPIEKYLEEQEKYIEKMQELEKDKLEFSRKEELSQYMENFSFYDLRNMDEEAYQQLLNMSKAAKEVEIANAKKAEEERIEREKKEAVLIQRRTVLASLQDFVSEDFELTLETTEKEFNAVLDSASKLKSKYLEEQEKIRKENEKLKAEQAKKDKEAEAERVRLQKIADKAQEDADRLKKEADEKAAKEAEDKRIADEQAEADKKAAARLEKEAAYRDWLKDNGVNEKTRPLFHIEKSDGEVKLFKLVSSFKIED